MSCPPVRPSAACPADHASWERPRFLGTGSRLLALARVGQLLGVLTYTQQYPFHTCTALERSPNLTQLVKSLHLARFHSLADEVVDRFYSSAVLQGLDGVEKWQAEDVDVEGS